MSSGRYFTKEKRKIYNFIFITKDSSLGHNMFRVSCTGLFLPFNRNFFVYTYTRTFFKGPRSLKWQCHEICWNFFPDSNPPGPLIVINRLKWFCWTIRFRKDLRILISKNLTRRSDSQCRVTYFANISAKTNLSGKQFYSVFSVF